MNLASTRPFSLRLTLLLGFALSWGGAAEAQHYTQTNLVSDLPTGATFQDTDLVNPWGLSRSSGSPWWVSDNGTGLSTLYNGTGVKQGLIVTIPPSPSSTGMGVPTGTVFNGTPDFVLPGSTTARFLFVAEDGSITGWNSGTSAVVVENNDGSDYKGMAIANVKGANYLFVANFAKKRIDMFDTTFTRVKPKNMAMFKDPMLPAGYSPFNIQNIGNNLYVAYAQRDSVSGDPAAGTGFGYVDVYSPSGKLLQRLQHGDWMDAPWGLVLAPGDFGAFSHQLLVGMFGSGQIAAFNPVTGKFVGMVKDSTDAVLMIDGLWALSFGNGANAGPATTLYFTSGPAGETHGLMGTLTPVSTEQQLGNGL